jgi:tRNA/rRNA methyltransferase
VTEVGSDRPRAPAVILVEPQLGENIGMAARAMANFGLFELRLVAPRADWSEGGRRAATSGVGILDNARVFATLRQAIADLQFVLATTARPRGQMKRVLDPSSAMTDACARAGEGQRIGILFGRERTGLENDEVSLADAAVTFPVDPEHASVNLAQAVLLMAYEWRRAAGESQTHGGEPRTPPASRASLMALFEHLEGILEALRFYPPDKRPVMVRNMRDILHRMGLSEQDVRTIRGVLRAMLGRRGGRGPV